MIKVAHLTSAHPAWDIRVFWKECRSLEAAGYDVTLIAPHPVDEESQGVHVRAVPPSRSRFGRFTKTTGQVYRRAMETDASLYHIHDPELLPIAKLLHRAGKKVIFDMHENLPLAIKTRAWLPRFFRPALSGFAAIAQRMLIGDMPVVFAEDSYAGDHPWISDYCVVLNLPLPRDLPPPRHSWDESPSLAYLGAVSAERGSVVTMESLAILEQRGLEIDFDCVGPVAGDHRAQLVGMQTENSRCRVRFHGYQRPNVGWKIVSRCHIGLAVLKAEPNYVGSYPTKIFEYMALGMPVITSNFPLYKSVVEGSRCGICVDPEDPQQLADGIRWLMGHPEQAEQMGARGKAAVETRFNWDTQAQVLLSFYETQLGSASHAKRVRAA